MRQTFRFFAAIALGALGVAGCSDSSGTSTGQLTVRLTDAPFPFSDIARVDVYVVRVDARKAEPTDNEAADEGDMDGWTTIASPGTLVNLLDLAGGKTMNLGAATLATGTYNGFRLIIDPSQSVLTLADGTHPDVKFPSAAQSGIKVKLDEPIELTEDGSVMTLDFDVGSSFVMRGNNARNGFIFKPVVRAVAQDITGSVTGSVRANSATGAGVSGATVEVLTAGSLIDDTDPTHVVRTTSTDANGDYRIGFLLPGTYVVRATPPTTSGFKPALLTGGLTITTGTETQNQIIVVAP
ncbi:MAG TPA: DUF4382 domain-containing protein [Gemmatimonadaceae bacterium]|jgi:hypothetical protein|nr:DUF4382 domain-containing protein [Gemmatimonadaceae bacterium]